jgi:twinkle protein
MRAIPLHAIPVIKSSDVDFKAWIHPEEKSRLISPDDIREDVYDQMHKTAQGFGFSLPWEKAASLVRFPPGKVTGWMGITHHGKTLMLKQLMQVAMRQGERVGIASFEETATELVADMVHQAAQSALPSREFVNAWAGWAKSRMVIYDQQAMVTPETIVGVANYCAATFGTTHFVIDSLMRLNLDGDDYDGQRKFFNLLGEAAKASKLHFHVVCHARKGSDDEKPLSIYDLKGSGDIINQVDKIIQVWRNKNKASPSDPDGCLIVHKQRGTPNWLGQISLWHDNASKQFLGGQFDSPLNLFSMNNDGIPQSVQF